MVKMWVEVKGHAELASGLLPNWWCPLAERSRTSTVQIRASYLKKANLGLDVM